MLLNATFFRRLSRNLGCGKYVVCVCWDLLNCLGFGSWDSDSVCTVLLTALKHSEVLEYVTEILDQEMADQKSCVVRCHNLVTGVREGEVVCLLTGRSTRGSQLQTQEVEIAV